MTIYLFWDCAREETPRGKSWDPFTPFFHESKTFFFFFISKKDVYSKKYYMQRSTKHIKDYKRRENAANKKKETNYKEKQLWNKWRDSLDVSPQALDQSKRELEKRASNWSSNLSKSSKVRGLRSLQMHHIKHHRAKFQMLDECFSNQFHQPKRKSVNDLERTHETPKVLKTKLHKRWAFPQCSNKWSTIFPQQRHMTHQSTK